MTITIELIYDPDCPNVNTARANLVKALAASSRERRWTEWDRSTADAPAYARSYGSPTILVGGKDVAGAPSNEGSSCCRLYRSGEGQFDGAPSVELIVEALRSNDNPPPQAPTGSSGWKTSLAAVPAIAIAFVPKLTCPACWPAYAALLGSVGLGFLLEARYLLPLTAAFLLLAVGTLAMGARTRRGYGPFFLGLAASSLMLVGKFVFDSYGAMYGGVAVLIAASVWNAWPVRDKDGSCPACARNLNDGGNDDY